MSPIPSPGRLIEVDGSLRHVRLQGGRGPVVVFESGLGGGVLEWGAVAEALRTKAVVFCHDRPGLGWSEPRAPQTDAAPPERFALGAARDLHRLLHQLQLPGPYVLVGHSLGALHVRAFAALYPQEMAGMVLVDPSHEAQFLQFPRLARMTRLQHRVTRLLLSTGPLGRSALRKVLAHGYAAECTQPLSPFAQTVLQQMDALWRRPAMLRAMAAEMAALEPSLDQIRALAAHTVFPVVPLRVISQGRPRPPGMQATLLPGWQALHAGLCQLSPDSAHVIASNSGHLVPLDEPELIAQTIEAILPPV